MASWQPQGGSVGEQWIQRRGGETVWDDGVTLWDVDVAGILGTVWDVDITDPGWSRQGTAQEIWS